MNLYQQFTDLFNKRVEDFIKKAGSTPEKFVQNTHHHNTNNTSNNTNRSTDARDRRGKKVATETNRKLRFDWSTGSNHSIIFTEGLAVIF